VAGKLEYADPGFVEIHAEASLEKGGKEQSLYRFFNVGGGEKKGEFLETSSSSVLESS